MADRKDIEALFRLYYRPLCLYATKLLQDADLAEDVVQESFIAYWNKVQDGDRPSSAKSYMYRIVHNRCVDALNQYPDSESLSETITEDVSEDTEARSFIWARLWTAIGRLPKKRRTILLMSKRDGMSYAEISKRLGISENTVHAQITKALKTLREGTKQIIVNFFL